MMSLAAVHQRQPQISYGRTRGRSEADRPGPYRGSSQPPNSEQRLLKRRTGMDGARDLRHAARRFLATLKTGLALIGLAAICGGLLVALDGDEVHRALPLLSADLQPAEATVVAEGPIGALETPLEREQRAVTEYIAKRYRVSEAAVGSYVAAAYRAGAQYSVDPLLILAVMAVESRYNP